MIEAQQPSLAPQGTKVLQCRLQALQQQQQLLLQGPLSSKLKVFEAAEEAKSCSSAAGEALVALECCSSQQNLYLLLRALVKVGFRV